MNSDHICRDQNHVKMYHKSTFAILVQPQLLSIRKRRIPTYYYNYICSFRGRINNTTVCNSNGSYYNRQFVSNHNKGKRSFHFYSPSNVERFTTTIRTMTNHPIKPPIAPTEGFDTSNDNDHDSDNEQDTGESASNESLVTQTETIPTETSTTVTSSSLSSIAPAFIHHSDDEWIPPNRPLVGDVGQAHLYAHIEDDKELRQLISEEEIMIQKNDSSITKKNESSRTNSSSLQVEEAEVVPPVASMDWLKTRRTMLTGQKMMKPDEAAIYKQSMTDIEIPIIEHMLFSQQELVQLIEAIGGQDVQVVLDHGDTKKGGRRRMGNDVMGIILVTGTNYVQMRNIATQIVRQLRRRKLQEVQVVGADLGPDGNMDDPNENWYVVDCGNYIIHIQDAKTRTAVNLAALWSGQDPIRKVDCTSDEAIDDYVARYPVPQNYTVGGSISATSTLLYDVNNWDATMKQFEKSRWARGNTNLLNAGSSGSSNNNTRFRNKPIVPKRRRKTSGRKT